MKKLKNFDLLLCIAISLPVGTLISLLSQNFVFLPLAVAISCLLEFCSIMFRKIKYKQFQLTKSPVLKKHIIITLFVFAISNYSFAQRSGTDQKIESLKTLISEKIHPTDPGLAILIKQNGKSLIEEYYGMASIKNGEKLTKETTMGIASMSKQFEGMAVLFLANEEKLSLDDPIGKYLKDLPESWQQITVRQLLSHSSGLPEITQLPEFMDYLEIPRTVDQILELAKNKPFRHETGEKYMYCNTGYTIVVKLIEKITEKTYQEFLDEKIFSPLGMTNTYSCSIDKDATNIATRYTEDSTGFKNAEEIHFSNLIGGGGVISNAEDLAIWADALLSGKNLPRNYKEIWNPNKLNNGESTQYGLGMGVSEVNGKKFYYHPGMGSGMNSINLIFPDENLSITIIRNVSKPAFSSVEIATKAADILFPEVNPEL